MKTLHSARKLLVGIVLWASLPVSLCVGASGLASWPTHGGDNAHTGHVAVDLDPLGYRLAWRRDLQLPLTLQPGSSAVVEDGRVFVATRDLGVEALDLDSGATLWRRQFDRTYRGIGMPSVYDGALYLNLFGHSSTSGNTPKPALVSLDAATGQERYRTDHEGQSGSGGQPVVANGGVYMSGGYFGGIDGYDQATGARLWSMELGLSYKWTPSADDEHVYVYNNGNYAGQRGELRVINPRTGTFFNIPDPSSPVIFNEPETAVLGDDGRAYVSRRGALVAFDVENREIDWRRDVGVSQFAIDGELLYSVTSAGLIELSLADGAVLRSWDQEALLYSGTSYEGYQPLLTDSHVLVMTASETLAINRRSWEVDWRLPASGRVALAGDTILVSSGFGGVAAFVPVPEPSAIGLVLGLGCCWFWRRHGGRERSGLVVEATKSPAL